jgi:hypothetical protein
MRSHPELTWKGPLEVAHSGDVVIGHGENLSAELRTTEAKVRSEILTDTNA